MKQRGKKLSAPTVILLTVLVVVAGIGLFNYLATRSVQNSHIVLPKDADATVGISGQSEDFIAVTKDNLPDVVATLARPAAYHQTLSSTVKDDENQNDRTVELWARNDVVLISDSSQDTVRYVLTDGSKAYIWYDSNPRSIAETVLPEDVVIDELVGIPTYEMLLHLAPTDILDAGYIQLAAPADNPCVYARIRRGDAGTETAWIDTASGLLCRAEYEKDGLVFGVVEQTALEVFDSADASIRSVFYLPDGSEPFVFSLETETP